MTGRRKEEIFRKIDEMYGIQEESKEVGIRHTKRYSNVKIKRLVIP